MQIIIDYDERRDGAFVVLRRGRLALAGLALAGLFAAGVWAAATQVAAFWARTDDPRLANIARAALAEREEDRRRLWEAGAGAFQRNVADFDARLRELSRRGAAIAAHIGLPTAEILPAGEFSPAAECAAAATAEEEAALSPEAAAADMAGALFSRSAALRRLEKKYALLGDQGVRLAMLRGATPMERPVLGRHWLASGYGYRRDPFTGRRAFHAGKDYSARSGTPVVAAASGVVIYAGRLGNYGNVLHLRHGDGVSTLYGHLRRLHVGLFQYVDRGEVIGEVGSTGRSTGPHLHYEVRVDNRPRPVNKTIRRLRQERGLLG